MAKAYREGYAWANEDLAKMTDEQVIAKGRTYDLLLTGAIASGTGMLERAKLSSIKGALQGVLDRLNSNAEGAAGTTNRVVSSEVISSMKPSLTLPENGTAVVLSQELKLPDGSIAPKGTILIRKDQHLGVVYESGVEKIITANLASGTPALPAPQTGVGGVGSNPQAGSHASQATDDKPVRVIVGVVVRDQRTGAMYEGAVDLGPTLDRIKNGGSYPHRNDGSIFQNRPPRPGANPLLPMHPAGYYKEYVVPTPGVSGPGPQRIVVGRNGEKYYTPDHYNTFIRID
ncbi:hypothetical protein HF682_09100 [Leeia sp. IMCC25680]|uniref:Uncharacterized protein n=2 Tax=Leeia aquatica TaxID=2725557 RepID=A0A847S6C2_9NEIS|nr:hypothetical protein [Leeia aquatica]